MIAITKSLFQTILLKGAPVKIICIFLVILLTMGIGFYYIILSPKEAILLATVNKEELSLYLNILTHHHIAYRLNTEANTVFVNAKTINEARLYLTEEKKVPALDSKGFELLDKQSFGMSELSEQITYQRALQGELERTIQTLEPIRFARVQLSLPKARLFQKDNTLPQAAVTVHLKKALTHTQIHSIQALISASVQNMKPENVTIIDQEGHYLSDKKQTATQQHFQSKKDIESYLRQKVLRLLTPIIKPSIAEVIADVTLELDDFSREAINPNAQHLVTEEEQEIKTPTKINKKNPHQTIKRQKKYHVGEEKEQFKRTSGQIKRITLSVIVPLSTTAQQLTQIEALVKSAIGFDETRKDQVHIAALLPTIEEEPNQYPLEKPYPVQFTTSLEKKSPYYGIISLLFISISLIVQGCVTYLLKRLKKKNISNTPHAEHSLSQHPLYTAICLHQEQDVPFIKPLVKNTIKDLYANHH